MFMLEKVMKKFTRKKLKKLINAVLDENADDKLDKIMDMITLYEETKYNEEKLNSYCRILKLPENKTLHNYIVGALRGTIKSHGPVTLELVGSVAKRVFKHLLEEKQS